MPITGKRTNAVQRQGSNANIVTAVPPSVINTVGSTPRRPPRTRRPVCPPRPGKQQRQGDANSGVPAPLARSRNGRKVRKLIRVALSMMPIASNSRKPPRGGWPLYRLSGRGLAMGTELVLAVVTAQRNRIAAAPAKAARR